MYGIFRSSHLRTTHAIVATKIFTQIIDPTIYLLLQSFYIYLNFQLFRVNSFAVILLSKKVLLALSEFKTKRTESFVGELANTAQTTRLASVTHCNTMNSSTSRYAEKKQTQEEIKRQIALLQARLEPEPESQARPLVPKSPKRKSIESVTLAPATPSPSQ